MQFQKNAFLKDAKAFSYKKPPIFHQKIVFGPKTREFWRKFNFFVENRQFRTIVCRKNIFRGVSSGNSLTITRIENRAGRNDLDVVNFYNQ